MRSWMHWWPGWSKHRGYTQFELLIDRIEGDQCRARVLSPPPIEAGAAQFTAPFPLAGAGSFCASIGSGGRDLKRTGFGEGSESMESLGKKLFEGVFRGEVKDSFERALGYAQASNTELLLRLRLADPELALWPWEFLWSEKVKDFLSFHQVVIVRQLEGGTEVPLPRQRGPLRILVVSADLVDAPPLNADEEIRQLHEALRLPIVAGRIVLDHLRDATQAALAEKLENGRYQIVHFIGHGHFDTNIKRGFLWLHDGKIEARELAKILARVRLVFLNCCHGARGDSHDLFSGVAQRLYLRGVRSVVAMQCSVQDDVAITFAVRFYRRLARGEVLERAMSEARRRLAIRDRYRLEWGIPVLYLRSPGELIGPQSIWLPLRTWGLRALLAGLMIALKGASDSYTCPSPTDVYIRFTRIPAGSIWVRSGAGRDARKREVFLRQPLCVSTYEVTQSQWEKVMGKNPSRVKGRDFPVTNFNMEDFNDFADHLGSRAQGANYRLLTDMEWEYAARGRTTGDFYFDGDADDLGRYGNCRSSDDGYENITSVGSFPANPFGLRDAYGNVSELVSDRYSDKELPVQVSSPDSQEPTANSWIHRGGSWSHRYWNCNSVHRFYMSEQTRARDDVGIRLARDPVQPY